MAAYQRFEMQLMMNESLKRARNLHDFPAMHPPLPPNMHMNTPSVVFGERKSNGTVPRSNGRLAETNTNDRIELRANGIEQSNRTKCAGNGLLCTATNAFPGSSNMTSNQFEAPNSRGRTVNAGKQDLSSTNVASLVNGQGHMYYGAANGLCSSATSTSSLPNRFFDPKHNDRSDVSNNQVIVSTTANRPPIENGTNGSTNCFVVPNNAIGDPRTNNHQNASNVTHSEAENGLLGKWDAFIGVKNSSNDHQGVQTQDHSAGTLNGNGNGNYHEMASNVPILPHSSYNSNDAHRINEKLNQNLPASSASEQKNDDVSTNDHSMDVNDSGFVDDRVDDDGNYYAYTDTDTDTDDDDERNFDDNLKTPATSKQQTNAANLCETAQPVKNGSSTSGGNKTFGSINQHPSAQTNSGNFVTFLCAFIFDFIPMKNYTI